VLVNGSRKVEDLLDLARRNTFGFWNSKRAISRSNGCGRVGSPPVAAMGSTYASSMYIAFRDISGLIHWVRKLHISNARYLGARTQCLCGSTGAGFGRAF
jgi:hypothetical protein